MLEKETMVKVTNRSNGSAAYTIPDLGNLYRSFEAGETKEVTMEELRKLSYVPGGKVMLEDYLLVENADAVRELLNEVEPEYNYKENDIKELLLNGSLDELMDCLEFAPDGVINLVKKIAVDVELNDIAKRKAILTATGFSVDSAVNINNIEKEVDGETDATPKRRVATPTTETTVKSRYNVVK